MTGMDSGCGMLDVWDLGAGEMPDVHFKSAKYQ
jgi:hypothetical protein